MANSDLVSLTISLSNPGVTAAGFGTGLIASPAAAWTERTRAYDGLTSVGDDWSSTSPEYLAASAYFGQSPRPERLIIGRCVGQPTMVQAVTVPTVANSTLYKLKLFNGGAEWFAAYTSDSNATRKEIVEGLKALITPSAWAQNTAYSLGVRVLNDTGKLYEVTTAGTSDNAGTGPAGTGSAITDGTVTWEYIATPNFAATEDDVTLTLTGSAAGEWFAVEPMHSTSPTAISDVLAVVETTANPATTIETDLAALKLASSEWYGLILLFKGAVLGNSSAGAAKWANANDIFLAAAVADTATATTAQSGATDRAAALQAAGFKRCHLFFHPYAAEFADAAEMGRWFPILPGSDNWRMKPLAGVTPRAYTPQQKTNLTDRYANFYYTLSGTLYVVGGDGKLCSGEFVDVWRGIDQWSAWVVEGGANLQVQNEKIPNTDAGRGLIADMLRAQNARAVAAGIFDGGGNGVPAPTVTVPPVSNTGSFNQTTRELSGIVVTARIAGAINKLAITAVITR